MKAVAFILTCLWYSCGCFGQEWTTTQLNDRVKIDFPVEAEFQYDGDGITKTYYVVEADYIISVTVNPMMQMPGAPEVDDLESFYKNFIDGALAAATNSKLPSVRKIEIGNLEAREVIYTKDFNGLTGILITKRVLFIDKVLFSFDVWDLTGKGQKKLKKRFFKSIKVI